MKSLSMWHTNSRPFFNSGEQQMQRVNSFQLWVQPFVSSLHMPRRWLVSSQWVPPFVSSLHMPRRKHQEHRSLDNGWCQVNGCNHLYPPFTCLDENIKNNEPMMHLLCRSRLLKNTSRLNFLTILQQTSFSHTIAWPQESELPDSVVDESEAVSEELELSLSLELDA